ncbi:MAG TPA: hypothetical protein VMV41_04170 [Cellulomonadaceae bacterium]|nr:hypothetical protein [Cellulomonadaceae bacterium]
MHTATDYTEITARVHRVEEAERSLARRVLVDPQAIVAPRNRVRKLARRLARGSRQGRDERVTSRDAGGCAPSHGLVSH